MSDFKKIHSLATRAAVYVQSEGEGIRVCAVDCVNEGSTDLGDWVIYGEGEETGESYRIYYSEVDLANDMFYALTLLEPTEE